MQFDIDFVKNRWLIKYLSIYLSRLDADDFLLRGELIETFNILTGRPIYMEQFYSLNLATLDTISGATAKG